MSEFDLILHAADKKTWLREKFTPSGIQRWLGEKFISDYKTKMDILRSVDDQIGSWAAELKELTGKMRGALKSSRLVDLALLLNLTNKKLLSIETEGQKIQRLKDEALREFELEHEMDLPEASSLPQKKSAGLWSDMKRDWVRKKFDDNKRKERFLALQEIVNHAEEIAQKVESAVKLLHVLRAKGEIGKYLEGLKTISILQKAFQTKFFAVYTKYLEEFVTSALNKAKEQEDKKELKESDLEYKPDDKPKSTIPGNPVLPLVKMKEEIPVTVDDPNLNQKKNLDPLSVDFVPNSKNAPNTDIDIPPTMSPSELAKSNQIHCEACGFENEQDAKFCGNCGANLREAPKTLSSPRPKLRLDPISQKLEPVVAAILNLENEKFWKRYSKISKKNKLERFASLLQHSEKIESLSPQLSIKLLNYAEEMISK